MLGAAARQLGMMVVHEGGSLFQHNMTMVVDGHTGVEHAIPVAAIYDDVRQLTERERDEFKRLPFNEKQYRKGLGAPKLHGETGFSTLERTWARPTFEVNGLLGGFTGEGAKTVIPATAMAKVSISPPKEVMKRPVNSRRKSRTRRTA